MNRNLNLVLLLIISLSFLAMPKRLMAQETESENLAPVPKISINPGVVLAGDDFQTEVTLDASSSFDLDGTIVSFKWELNGGRIIEGENDIIAIATFPGIRDYPVTLTVTDNEGASAVANALVLVKNNQAPQARIQITPPTVVVGDDFNTEVTLDARASFDLDGVITSFKWELNGGRIIEGENAAVAKAVFPGIRNYPVTLTITDNDGATATASEEVVVGRIAIQEVQLVDAQDDEILGSLKDGDIINLSDFEEGFSLLALTNPPVIGSVVFRLNGESFRAESVVPYTLFGDINRTGDILGGTLEPGSYELEVIPFSEKGAQGDVGIITTINFEVVAGLEEVREFVLINAESNEEVRSIQNGDQINLANYPQGIGILAKTFPEEVGSVVFFLNEEQARVENLAPYALSGDQNGDVNPLDLPVGSYTLKATPFSERRAEGDEGLSLEINFDIINEVEAGNAIVRLLEVNTATESVTIKNFGTESQDLSAFQFCLGPGQYNALSNYTTLSGDLTLEPNEALVIDLSSGSQNVQALPDANGSLLLFANTNFGSNSGDDILDAIQWGSADGNRISQAINAGRWTDANDFVAGATPYNYVGDADDLGPTFWIDDTNIRMLQIIPESDEVLLQNFDNVSRDLSNYFFCTQPGVYPQLGNAAQVEILAGDLNLAPGESVRVRVLTAGGVLDNTASIFLFSSNVLGFNNQNAFVTRDFAQWGAANGFRVENAVATGRWDDAANFIAGSSPFNYVGGGNDIGAAFWIDDTAIRMFQINPEGDEVVIRNFDNVSRELSNYFFCTQPGVYPQLGNAAQVEILAGDLNLAPGESVKVKVLTPGGVITDNGSIFLFSSNVLGFNNQNPFVTRDFAQWDAPNGFRVENAVATGRWDAASSFIEGNDPFSYLGDADDIGSEFWEAGQAGEAIIRMIQVNTASESVTLKNFGSASQDISDYQFCLGPGQYNILSNYASIIGDLNLAPNEEVTFDLSSGTLNVQALPDADGSLLLFANNNFGSNSGDDIKDAIQWGAANGNRVSQAVNAGRWTSANDFVAGATPYNFIGAANDIGPDFWEATLAGEAVIRMIEVNTASESVTLKNFGTASQDVSDYQFCLGPGQYNILSNYTNTSADLNLAPNEEVTFDLTSGTLNVQALPDADGSLLLFANTSFGSDNPNDIKDAIQWGAANGNRVGQAVLAGRWTNSSDFVAGETPFTFVGGANDIGPNFWNASTSLNVYPNPSNGQLIIEGQSEEAYEVRDNQGIIIQEGKLKGGQIRLQLSEGVYFISNHKETKRAIIK